MAGAADADRKWTTADLAARIVRYADLRPCLNAFIDTRTPGSEAKENFTIIGPGVSENPDQFVHIAEPHGFNIGGARQPPRCVNSQHSHDTAEVFVIHTGRWRFDCGEHGDDAQIEGGPGDVVSIPIHTFRGFSNVGEDAGFLWVVLGGDNPGRVLWAPHVFELAKDHGLVLLENGALIDRQKGEEIPAGAVPMPITSRAQVDALRTVRPSDANEIIAKASAMAVSGETLVIGDGGSLPAADGFTLTQLILPANGESAARISDVPEVAFVHDGVVEMRTPDATISLGAGDTITVPIGLSRSYVSKLGATLFLVRGEHS